MFMALQISRLLRYCVSFIFTKTGENNILKLYDDCVYVAKFLDF